MTASFSKTIVFSGVATTPYAFPYFSDGLEIETLDVSFSDRQAKAMHDLRERMIETSKLEGLEIMETRIAGFGVDGLTIKDAPTKPTIVVHPSEYRWCVDSPRGRLEFSIRALEIEDFLVENDLLPAHRRTVGPRAESPNGFPTIADEAAAIDPAARSLAAREGLDLEADGPDSIARDMVASIGHWVTENGGSRGDAVKAIAGGMSSFLSQQFDPEQCWLDFEVSINASAPKGLVEIEYQTGGEPYVGVDEEGLAKHLAGENAAPAPGI